jgi:hypothetical protein
VLEALRTGRVFISREPDGPQIYLAKSEVGVSVRVVGAERASVLLISDRGVEQASAIGADDWRQDFDIESRRYVRAQVMDEHGQMLALSNPVY